MLSDRKPVVGLARFKYLTSSSAHQRNDWGSGEGGKVQENKLNKKDPEMDTSKMFETKFRERAKVGKEKGS